MKKLLPLAGLLLLTACAAPQTDETPTPPLPSESASAAPTQTAEPVNPEPTPDAAGGLEAALPLLELAEGEEVLDWAAGDLDGDGREDLAVVVERNEEDPTGERWGRVRELCVLYGEGGGYRLGENSETLLLRSGEGGMADPYGGISIDGGLHISQYGGSAFQWAIGLHFIWKDNGLILAQAQELNTYGPNGTEAQWDFAQGQYTLRTYSEENTGLSEQLLYQTGLTVSEPWTLEEMGSAWQIEEASALPPLPSLLWYNYGHDFTDVLQHSPEEMLDKVKETYYPDMVRVDIPWDEGTRENYSAALGYPAPSYYYTDGERILSYFSLEEQVSDGGQSFFRHTVTCEKPDDWNFYQLADETGEAVS